MNPPQAQPTTEVNTSSSSRGLGGEGDKNSLDSMAQRGKTVLEKNTVPPEIMTLFEDLKKFIKQQKAIKEENSEQRFNVEPIMKIDETIKHTLQNIDLELEHSTKQVETLKQETTKLLNCAEIACSLVKSEIPSNIYVNKYFDSLLEDFEHQMNVYSKQIKLLEVHLANMNKAYSCDEMFQIMRKQHEIFISLADKVYMMHEEISKHKLNQSKTTTIEKALAFD